MGGGLSDEEVRGYYLRAKAFLFPGEEDFGITPVEAQSAGTPVLAYGRGGACETVEDGRTGLLFHAQTADSLAACIERFEAGGVSGTPGTDPRPQPPLQRTALEEELRAYCARRMKDWAEELRACAHEPNPTQEGSE